MTRPQRSPSQGSSRLSVWVGRNRKFVISLTIILLVIGFFLGAYLHSVASVGSIRITCAAATPSVSGFTLAMGVENPSLFSVDADLGIFFSKPSTYLIATYSERAFSIPSQRTVVEFFPFVTELQYPGTLKIVSTYHFLVLGVGDLQVSFKFQQLSTIDAATIPQTDCTSCLDLHRLQTRF